MRDALRHHLSPALLPFVCALTLCPLLSHAAQEARLFEAGTNRQLRLPYLLFLPADYDKEQGQRWPLVLYLHGGSLRGDDVNRLRTMGLPQRLEKDRSFPFIVVSPLCAEGEIWTDAEAVAALLDRVQRDCRVDASRVYITGHSMGGRGVLYFAYKMPQRFAAAVALSPVWIMHGVKDTAVPIADSQELVKAIENIGGKPRFTPLPERDHFILDLYDRQDVFDWLAQHSRSP